MVKELDNACEPAFTAMSRIAWTTVNLVSGQSSYVDDLVKAIEQVVDAVKPLIEQKKYARNFFDKAARCVPSLFTVLLAFLMSCIVSYLANLQTLL